MPIAVSGLPCCAIGIAERICLSIGIIADALGAGWQVLIILRKFVLADDCKFQESTYRVHLMIASHGFASG